MSELRRYAKAMKEGHVGACIAIEKEHNLYGFPPEIVSVGLSAIDRGENADEAINAYLNTTPKEGGDASVE